MGSEARRVGTSSAPTCFSDMSTASISSAPTPVPATDSQPRFNVLCRPSHVGPMSRRQTASGTGDRQGRSTSRPGTASVGSGQVYPHPSPHKREARGMPNVAGLVGEPTLAAATPHELRATYEGLLGL